LDLYLLKNYENSGAKSKMNDEIKDPTDICYYGGDETIHSGGEVNVELDEFGKVVAVWFRCQPLQFTQTQVKRNRAHEMIKMYLNNQPPAIDALVLRES
jgi:hypothetical protein